MSYKAGESVTLDFTVTDSTGTLADADSLPTGTEVVDGTDAGTTVTITNKATGIYKAAWTISGSKDSQLDLRIEATVGGTATGAVLNLGKLDSLRLDDLNLSTGDGETAVNHDTGGTDNLAYQTSGGDPIEDATVRAYLKSEYDSSPQTATVKAITTTDANGRWVDTIYLTSGTAYTLVFEKTGAYGPDTQEVTP